MIVPITFLDSWFIFLWSVQSVTEDTPTPKDDICNKETDFTILIVEFSQFWCYITFLFSGSAFWVRNGSPLWNKNRCSGLNFLAHILVLCMPKIAFLCFLIRPNLTNLSLFKNLSITNNGNIYRDDVTFFGMNIDKGQIHILRSNLDVLIISQGRILWNKTYFQKLSHWQIMTEKISKEIKW